MRVGKDLSRHSLLGFTKRGELRDYRDTPFAQFYRIISACQDKGFRKFALKAMTPVG